MINSSPIGTLPTGEAVESFTLNGAGGLSLQAITYGGIVTHLRVPDRAGKLADVVLGFDRLEDYLSPHPYFGAIAGRVAGRITRGQFTLDGKTYELERNDPPNHLHGGARGFDKHLWKAEPLTRDGSPAVRFSRLSPDGECGYPGNVAVSVTYSVTPDNAFVIESEATSDRATPFSLTHHSYFNLAGEGSGSAEGHELQIFADAFAPSDAQFALLGRREPVADRGNDLRNPRTVRDVVPNLLAGHGDLYFVRRPRGETLVIAARLRDPTSGRTMTVQTTEDCIQLYTGVYLDGTLTGKSGQPYGKHAGLCLECEGYPDGVNAPSCGDILLRPGQVSRQTTIYEFSVS